MKPVDVLSCDTVCETRLFSVIHETLRLADGSSIVRDSVVHPGAAAALIFESADTVLLVRQYRRAVDQVLLEISAGVMNKGEDPRDCVAREIAEETGFQPRRVEPVMAFYPSPGMLQETTHLFVAFDLEPGTQKLDDDEQLEVVRMPYKELQQMVARCEIRDGKTALLVSFLTAFPPAYLAELGKGI